jgi:hypothetical protein
MLSFSSSFSVSVCVCVIIKQQQQQQPQKIIIIGKKALYIPLIKKVSFISSSS